MKNKPWYKIPEEVRPFQDLLLKESCKRYHLELSDKIEAVATVNSRARLVAVNPKKIAYITKQKRRELRVPPLKPSRSPQWQKLVTEAAVHHEVAHIRFSDDKPEPVLLGWLWNVLEDERIERLQAEGRGGGLRPCLTLSEMSASISTRAPQNF